MTSPSANSPGWSRRSRRAVGSSPSPSRSTNGVWDSMYGRPTAPRTCWRRCSEWPREGVPTSRGRGRRGVRGLLRRSGHCLGGCGRVDRRPALRTVRPRACGGRGCGCRRRPPAPATFGRDRIGAGRAEGEGAMTRLRGVAAALLVVTAGLFVIGVNVEKGDTRQETSSESVGQDKSQEAEGEAGHNEEPNAGEPAAHHEGSEEKILSADVVAPALVAAVVVVSIGLAGALWFTRPRFGGAGRSARGLGLRGVGRRRGLPSARRVEVGPRRACRSGGRRSPRRCGHGRVVGARETTKGGRWCALSMPVVVVTASRRSLQLPPAFRPAPGPATDSVARRHAKREIVRHGKACGPVLSWTSCACPASDRGTSRPYLRRAARCRR